MTQRRDRIHPLVRARARELRRSQTPAEHELWPQLRDRRLDGLQFRRQHPIGRFIIDFCCRAVKLAIEIDGDVL
jgi:very-short-patch-repair endonuclease